jgi:hypothetical protein
VEARHNEKRAASPGNRRPSLWQLAACLLGGSTKHNLG